MTALPTEPVRVCGRAFTPADLEAIVCLVLERPRASRSDLARLVCERFDWRAENGQLKEGSCRTALVRMNRAGWIPLPEPKRRNNNQAPMKVLHTARSDPKPVMRLPLTALGPLELVEARRGETLALWREMIDRHHYLGYRRAPGAQMRYLVRSSHGFIAAVGFGPAVWRLKPRDQWIGWTPEQRERNLQFVVGQNRFLIFPWIQTKELATRILSICGRRLPDDWEARYGRRPVLMETFVEIERFRGTVYRAGNWVSLGLTQGRGRMDRYGERNEPVKEIFVYPLSRRFRSQLCLP